MTKIIAAILIGKHTFSTKNKNNGINIAVKAINIPALVFKVRKLLI